MSKSTHLILKKLVLNNFHLKVALWDKIQKSLLQEESQYGTAPNLRVYRAFKSENILPLYVPSRKARFDIKTLSETGILPSFSVGRKGT